MAGDGEEGGEETAGCSWEEALLDNLLNFAGTPNVCVCVCVCVCGWEGAVIPMVGYFHPKVTHDWVIGPWLSIGSCCFSIFFPIGGEGAVVAVVGGILEGRGGLWLRGT